jgi:hypothetical protein
VYNLPRPVDCYLHCKSTKVKALQYSFPQLAKRTNIAEGQTELSQDRNINK